MKRHAGALLLALICQSALTVSAEARSRHHHHRHHAHYHRGHSHQVHHHHRERQKQVAAPAPTVRSWLGGFGPDVVSVARSYVGSGAIFGRSNLWCARFMNVVLSKTGHSGTGSDMAASFSHYGRPVSGPRVGAIAVMSRRGGGHVGIVSGIDAKGNPILISGNNGGRVREAVYPRARIYAYRLPS